MDTLYSLVRRPLLIDLFYVLSEEVVDLAARHLTFLLPEKVVVRENLRGHDYVSDVFVCHSVNQNLCNQLVFRDYGLKLFREDVLSALCYDDSLLSSGEIEETFVVKISQVSRVKPAVL